MSGTSCDGVDVALVEVRREADRISAALRGFRQMPFPQDMRQVLLDLAEVETSRIDRLCAANFFLAKHYVSALRIACMELRIPENEIDLIGSHGQTVHHMPAQGATLQIGEPSVLAEAFRVPVIADFRPKDLAAGGQGAPLVPYVDFLLLSDPARGRAVQNLGGIGNVTYLPPSPTPDQVVAFDTGPGNMVMDGLVNQLTGGHLTYDRDGQIAAKGQVKSELLHRLLENSFFAQPPPKSTGRELFGSAFIQEFLRMGRACSMTHEDLVATATALTVESMALGYDRFVKPLGPIHEIILSGGGAKNPILMGSIRRRFDRALVRVSDEFGIPSAAKEALCFAVLADETLEGRPNNLPSATGARRPVVLGKIVLPD